MSTVMHSTVFQEGDAGTLQTFIKSISGPVILSDGTTNEKKYIGTNE